MKLDRQIGILSMLLQGRTITMPYLAEKFEVSRRTINRDIEDLCKAGIPIITKQGVSGGVSIMENYKIDRTLLTHSEMQDIIAGLRGLDSVNGTNRYGQLMEKLSIGSSDFMVGNQSVLIDLSSWYKNAIAPKIEIVRGAIDTCKKIQFVYYSPKGESIRCIEPYYLIFEWSSWYVWGWCVERKDYRLFKLNRMDKVTHTEQEFLKRQVPVPDLSDKKVFPGGIKVKALFDKACEWRLVEEFGIHSFCIQSDGRLLFRTEYTNEENLITWLLSFGDKVELLEPVDIREEIRCRIERMKKNYEN